MKTLSKTYFPTLLNIQKAANRLDGIIQHTPLSKSMIYSNKYDASILLKREDLQNVRSYKIRGAYNKIASLSSTEKQKGIVCASAGNHAQGVAFSCNKKNIHGTIFMPSTTPQQKIEKVKWFGESNVTLMLVGDTFDDAKKKALKYSNETQKTFIHPFDDPQIIEGQATIGLEILEQTSQPIDYLFLPVGGGGLAAGVSEVFKTLSPNTKIIGAEPKGAPSMHTSLQKNCTISLESINPFVDGAAVKKVGELNFEICKSNLDNMLLIDEGALCSEILELYNKEAIVVEPAGALSLSSLAQYSQEIKGKNVVCIVSGSNNDITRMEEIKEKALLYNQLKHYFLVKFPQRSGALRQFVVDILGPNDDITHFEYTKKNYKEKGTAIVGLEIKNKNSLETLIDKMKQNGFFGEYLNNKPLLMETLV
tara:strand:- start:1241 stop:2506 length:1266 start_codon:yes stop_codon:yes gene_type:complete